VKGASLNAIVLVSAGIVATGLGFLFLESVVNATCTPITATLIKCTDTGTLGELASYLAISGSALLMTGVWETGIGRKRVVREGAWMVIATGATILGVGLFVTRPLFVGPSTLAFETGYYFGLLGGALLLGGLAKLQAGVKTVTNIKQPLNFMLASNVKSVTLIALGVFFVLTAFWLNPVPQPCGTMANGVFIGCGGDFIDPTTTLVVQALNFLGVIVFATAAGMFLASFYLSRENPRSGRHTLPE
jgi:hypothetical protein